MATAKIAISTIADTSLDNMVKSINENFSAGRVTKVDLASWIIQYFESNCLEKCRDKIQQDHFDQVVYLESVVKEIKSAKKEGKESKTISELLAPLSMAKNSKLEISKRNQRDNAV